MNGVRHEVGKPADVDAINYYFTKKKLFLIEILKMNIKHPTEHEMVIRLFCKQCLELDVLVKSKRFGAKLPGFKVRLYHFLAR